MQQNLCILPQNLLQNQCFMSIVELAMLLQKNTHDVNNSVIYNILSLFKFKTIDIQKYILRIGEKYHGFITYKEIMNKWSINEFYDFIYVNYLNGEEDRIESEKNK